MNPICGYCNKGCCHNFQIIDGNTDKDINLYQNYYYTRLMRVVLKPNNRFRCLEFDYKKGKCTIYNERPNICREYKCKTLIEYENI